MGGIRRERGVLKLVHPGRYIEVHRQPIRAAEVMKRNPRHSITRPDVFDFPWIVVKPESVLLPGSVFLIVPNRTIYELLKAKGKGKRNQSPSSKENQSPKNHVHQQLKQHSSLSSSFAGMSSELQTHSKGRFGRRERKGEAEEKLLIFKKLFLPLHSHSPFSQRTPKCQHKTMSPDHVENMCKFGRVRRSQNQSQLELWPKVVSHKDTQKKIERESLEESTFESRSYRAIQYKKKSKVIKKEMPRKDVKLQFVPNEQAIVLKSCLRRPDSIRKSLNLKVSFNIPIEKEEQQKEFTEFKAKFSGYLNW